MHMFGALSITTFALGYASAVDILLYANDAVVNNRCSKQVDYVTCSDIGIDVCCYDDDYTIYSTSAKGLQTSGVPEFLVAFGFGGCDKSCDSGGGDTYECVDCTGGSEIIGGALFQNFNAKGAVPVGRDRVKPDMISFYDAKIDAYRSFRVDDRVPQDVIAELKHGFRNGTNVEDLSTAVQPFEVKQLLA